MAISYRPPGVLPVSEVQSSSLAPAFGAAAEIPCIIGEARGFETFTELIAPTGTAEVTLTKKGISITNADQKQLSFTVINPISYQTINPGNFVITQTAGTATGDETTTFRRSALPGTLTAEAGTAAGTAIAAGHYRYAVSWVVNIDTGSGTATYETGLGSATQITLNSAAPQIDLSNVPAGTAAAGAGIAVTGRNVYRSKNLGTTVNPNWGPWYRLTGAGTVTIGDATTATYSDTNSDPSANPNEQSGIASGDSLTVQYDYADTNYFEPTLFVDFNDITDKYGPAFTDTGAVSSKVSFGAKLAMLNGAQQVVCVALPASPSTGDWDSAVLSLESDEDSTIVVPLTGTASVLSAVAAHCTTMYGRNVYRSAIFGKDGTAGTVSPTDLRDAASGFNREDIQMISPAIFRYYNTYLNREVEIGGQYAAAALAGMRASRGPQDSLTRQSLAGFSSIGEKRSTVAMNQDAQAGLTVIEDRGGVQRIRHDISTAPSTVNTREIPVLFQKYNMIRGILDTYDRGVVGVLKANQESLGAVIGMTQSYLNDLVRRGQLAGFSGLTARFSASDPTVVEVRWQYRPVYTIHYVAITIGVSLTSGAVNVGVNVANPLL